MVISSEPISNRTKKYLLPSLQAYGKQFVNDLKSLPGIMAAGIDDCNDINRYGQPSIHLLMKATDDGHIQKLRTYEDIFLNDYNYSKGLHMLIFALPYRTSYKYFLRSKYSKMYSQDQLIKLFGPMIINPLSMSPTAIRSVTNVNKMRRSALMVLRRNKSYKNKFEESIGVELQEDAELDYLLKPEEEIFNYHPDKLKPQFNILIQNIEK